MIVVDEIKKRLYTSLLKYHNQIKDKKNEIVRYEIILNSDNTTFNYKVMSPDENFWIKPPYPCNKDFKSEYYEELLKKAKDKLTEIEYKFNKLMEKLDIKTNIYDRIFYYKYIEELNYKEVLQKTPYSESRFNVYYKLLRESLKKGVKEE